jgi:hypothetical protein
MARREDALWFDTAVQIDDSLSDNLYGYYSVDGGPNIQLLPKIALELYGSEASPEGDTVNLYRGSFNPVIPEGLGGHSVVLKVYDPDKMIDYLEYDSIDVCTDEATTAVVSPSSASVSVGRTRQFTTSFYAADSLPTENHVEPLWGVAPGGGTMNPATGVFTAETVGGPFPVSMTAGGVSDLATVTVVAASSVSGAGMSLDMGMHM